MCFTDVQRTHYDKGLFQQSTGMITGWTKVDVSRLNNLLWSRQIVNSLKLLRDSFDRLRYETAQRLHLTQWELTSFIEGDTGIFESSFSSLNLASCSF
ncbi:hypothetical protein PoB_006335400 [Plakobranchus ocellatus]|uniref:Uncharacterized protein n=1 Tax=Plakobranchus ocellatus TaxID=259542 RepID=A0AAV4CY38_9GAST|nr:hypothetical protein PoB_006335400 [Plakobranchus ocellatus]